MDYEYKIKQLVADILNNKISYKDISSWREFYTVQRIFYKMNKLDKVKEMADYASEYLDKTYGKKRGDFGRMTDIEFKDSGLKLTKYNGYAVADVDKFNEFVGRQKKFINK